MLKLIFQFCVALLALAGALLVISSFSGKYGDPFDGIIDGIGCFIGAATLYGFSIIVEASSLYIEKQKEAEE